MEKWSKGNAHNINSEDIEQIFKWMEIIYGAAWSNKFAYSNLFKTQQKKMWLRVIQNMNKKDVSKIFTFLVEHPNDHEHEKFPPNPIQFKGLLKKLHTKNIPSVEKLYEAAIKSDWSFHPLVFHCANKCDIFWLRRASQKDGLGIFKQHYDREVEHYINGAILEAPHVSLGRQKKNSEDQLEKLIANRAKEIKNNLNESTQPQHYLDYIKQKIGVKSDGK